MRTLDVSVSQPVSAVSGAEEGHAEARGCEPAGHAEAKRAERRRLRATRGRYRVLALLIIAAMLAVTVWVLIIARDGTTMYTRHTRHANPARGALPARPSGPRAHHVLDGGRHH